MKAAAKLVVGRIKIKELTSQTNAVNQPTTNTRTINGLNTLDFDGSTSKMIYAGPTLSLNMYTKFAVFEIDTVDNNQNNLISGVTSNPNPPYDGSDALFNIFSGGYRLLQMVVNLMVV